MISYGDMLDALEKNEPQKEPTVAEKKVGNNVPEKKFDNEPKNKDGESKKEVDEPEDVI